MKTFFALMLLTVTSLAVAQDGYHSFEQTVCENDESCLVTNFDNVIKFIPVENRRGEIVGERLTSESSLADVAYEGAKLCYYGQAQDVCRMLDLMSGGWHGHASITMFYCKVVDEKISTGYRLEYDMDHATSFPAFEIKKCE